MMLEIKALGSLIIEKDGKILDPAWSLRAQVILTYLALESGIHNRSTLAAMFWPDSSEQKAQSSLRVLLTELRKEAGEYLNIDRINISINPESEINLDVHAAEKYLDQGKTDQVLDLYRGDFLSGVYIPGSIEFENWHRWENERIRISITEYLEEAIKNKICLGLYEESEKYSRSLLRIDPTNEAANIYYAFSLAITGHRSSAVKQLQTYFKTLKEIIGIKPSRKVKEILEWISAGDLEQLKTNLTIRHNLPNPQTSFIGREDELVRLSALLTNPNCRLISLIGMGGIGKTRLSVQCIRENLQHFPDGVFFVPLELVSSSEEIIQAIAEALDFKFDTVISTLNTQTQLLDVINDFNALILFDGFEHLTKSGNLVSTILNNAPEIRILVTSRRKLNIPGEWVHILEGMTLSEKTPDLYGDLPESLELFLHRSKQNNPDLVISGEDLISVSRICGLVEGLPLAIELAAGWTSVLTFSEIANELSQTYEFLDGQSKTTDEHQNIQAVLTSSWNLLGPSQQLIMANLSVFQGSFSIQAAKQISGATLTDISALADNSMIRKNQLGKFEMHSVVQEFCQAPAHENHHDSQSIRQKHFQYYAKYLSCRVPDMYLLSDRCTQLEIKDELPNIQSAAEYAIINHDEFNDREIIKNLYSYYIIHGWYEGGLIFKRMAELLENDQPITGRNHRLLIAKIKAQQGFFYSNLGLQEESEEFCRLCLPVLEKAGEHRELAICIQNLGINAIFRGEYDQSLSLLDQAIRISKLTACSSFPSFHLWVGYVQFLMGDYKSGMESFFISLNLFKQDNNERGTAFSLSKMGLAQDGLGNYKDASAYHKKSLNIFRQSNNKAGQGYALSRMSLGALLLQDFHNAQKLGEEALSMFKDIGHRWGICASLSKIAYARLGLSDIPEARRLFSEALTLAQAHQLDPLSLHALAGIACLKVTTGAKKEGLALMEYIQQHPKTPEIYITVNKYWFNIGRKPKQHQMNRGLVQDISVIAGKILEQEI